MLRFYGGEKLTAYFALSVNKVYSRFRFRSINQDEGESVTPSLLERVHRHLIAISIKMNMTDKFGTRLFLAVGQASYVAKPWLKISR